MVHIDLFNSGTRVQCPYQNSIALDVHYLPKTRLSIISSYMFYSRTRFARTRFSQAANIDQDDPLWTSLELQFSGIIIYIFCFSVIIYVWILRKCEKHDKNGFSRAFSRTQPNIRKYFPKHLLKYNQTLESIFLSRKYFHLKLFQT